MSSTRSSQDESPTRSRGALIGFAAVIAALIAVAVFSLSKTTSTPWTSPLKDPQINDTLRRDLPQIEHPELARAITNLTGEGRWVLLTFWSITCAPCMAELPTLNEMSAAWQGPGFQALTVNMDKSGSEELDLARDFLNDEQIALPTFFDKDGAIKNAFQVNEYPRHLLIAPTRQIVWDSVGAYRWNEAKARDQLIQLMERAALPSTGDAQE